MIVTSSEMCRDEAGSVAASSASAMTTAASMYPFMEPGHMASSLKLASDVNGGHYPGQSQAGAAYHGLPHHPSAHHHPAYTRDLMYPHHPMFPHPAADPFSGQ